MMNPAERWACYTIQGTEKDVEQMSWQAWLKFRQAPRQADWRRNHSLRSDSGEYITKEEAVERLNLKAYFDSTATTWRYWSYFQVSRYER